MTYFGKLFIKFREFLGYKSQIKSDELASSYKLIGKSYMVWILKHEEIKLNISLT